MFRKIKKEIRIIGFDDSPFRFTDRKAKIIGVVCRGGVQVDGVVSGEVSVDGLDSTERIAGVVRKTSHYPQLRVIMLDGITFGGFNVVDINTLRDKTGLPVIVVISDKPNLKNIKKALGRFDDREKRWRLMEKAGEIRKCEIRNGVVGRKNIFFQTSGISESDAKDILNVACIHSVIPEPIRIAHMIGYGLRGGEHEKKAD